MSLFHAHTRTLTCGRCVRVAVVNGMGTGNRSWYLTGVYICIESQVTTQLHVYIVY